MDNKTFIDALSARSGIDKSTVTTLIESLGSVIAETALNDESVAVPTFGIFESKKKTERIVVHPSTGRKLLVPPKLTLTFKPAASLKQKINR